MKTFKKIAAASMLLFSACVVCSCGSLNVDEMVQNGIVRTLNGKDDVKLESEIFSGENPVALAIVYGIRANNKMPDLSCCDSELEILCNNGGVLTVVVPDGAPSENFRSWPISAVDAKLEENARKADIAERMRQIKTVICTDVETQEAVCAKTAEADTLGAVIVAARQLSDVSEDTERGMIILDNGIPTAGKMDLCSDDGKAPADANVPEYLEILKNMHNIPDLSGFSLSWYGFCQTAQPQKPLTEKDRLALKEIWEGILTESKAKFRISDKEFAAGSVPDTLPTVSVVPVSDDHIDVPVKVMDFTAETVAGAEETAVKMDANTMIKLRTEFCSEDSKHFLNPAKAEADLRNLAEVINAPENADTDLVLIGMIATVKDSEDGGVSFSKERAETIKQKLVEFGVDASRLTTVGAGFNDSLRVNVGTEDAPEWQPLHQYDLKPDGSLDEDIAPQNRAVYIVTTDSDVAKILKYD